MRACDLTKLLIAIWVALALGCGDDDASDDAAVDSGGADAAVRDAGEELDAPPSEDASGDDASGDDANVEDASVDAAVDDAEVDAQIDAGGVCGDDEAQPAEQCDGADLRGRDCDALGFGGGTLSCDMDCNFDMSSCTASCGNGRCERTESADDCPDDCAATSVGAGFRHTCATLADGTLRCWGAVDGHRMGGAGDSNTPIALPGVNDAVEVCAGRRHSCIRHENGSVSCWGANGFGAAGQHPMNIEVFPPAPVSDLSNASSLACGQDHTCAVEGDAVVCWGRNDYGQAAAARTVRLLTPASADLVPSGSFTYAVAAGGRHTCAGLGPGVNSGGAACWGYGGRGALGYGNRFWRDSVDPSPVAFAANVGAGLNHSCAMVLVGLTGSPPRPDYDLLCWGANNYGQLGIPAGADQLSPVLSSAGTAALLAAGRSHTCRAVSGTIGWVDCWGNNDVGQLGDGTTTSTHMPQRAVNELVTHLSSSFSHTCAVLDSGGLRCWGDNSVGQLGHGEQTPFSSTPVAPGGFE